MSQDTLAIPQAAVAAAGRALQYTIADLTEHQRNGDLPVETRKAIGDEIMEMMDANKAMFSALPFCPEVIPSLQRQLKHAQSTTEDLQALLIERTEQSMATALRDAETIRKLRLELHGIATMPEYDQDDAHRLRNIARVALKLSPPSTGQSPRGA